MFIFEPSADNKSVVFLLGHPRTRKVVRHLPARGKKHAQEMSVALNNLLVVYGDDTIHLWIQGEDYSKEALDKIAERFAKNELTLENGIKIDGLAEALPAKQNASS